MGHSVILLYFVAPNFSIDLVFGKAYMGSLVHSRECGKATAVSEISFHPDLVAETGSAALSKNAVVS